MHARIVAMLTTTPYLPEEAFIDLTEAARARYWW